MKNSKLLDLVFQKTDELTTKYNKKLKADFFMLAVFKLLNDFKNNSLSSDCSDSEIVSELEVIDNRFKDNGYDYGLMAEKIEAALQTSSNYFENDLVFSKIRFSAESQAKKINTDIVTSDMFVDFLLKNPTKDLKTILDSKDDKNFSSNNDEQSKEVEEKDPFEDLLEQKKKELIEKLSTLVDDDDFDDEDDTDSNNSNKTPDISGSEKLVLTVQKTKEIQNKLLSSVYGQDHAINSFVSAYFQSELVSLIQKNRNKPLATFLFAGPPGVGKTFLAEQVASVLDLPYKRFDMSEYSDKESNLEFCGLDKSYKASHEGNVTGFVSKNPKSILLFDEIEKAHTNVIYLFLQILDAGRVRDNYTDEEVSFTDTIIIFTTNAGKQLYEDADTDNLSTLSQKSILNALANDINPVNNAPFFPRAICSRFASGNIIMFNHLIAGDLIRIINREFNKQIEGFGDNVKLKINIDPNVAYSLMFAQGGKADARTIRGKSSNFIYQELFELFRLAASEKNALDVSKIRRINFCVDIPQTGEISSLFNKDGKYNILFFCEKNLEQKIRSCLGDSFNVYFADTIDKAKNILVKNDITLAICDLFCHKKYSRKKMLNLEDIASQGISFIEYVNLNLNLPLFILQLSEGIISQEELLSFTRNGAKGIFTLSDPDFSKKILDVCININQQNKMNDLARSNKVLNFKTLQNISEKGNKATIVLYDLKLAVSVDAEDSKSILKNVSKPNVLFKDVIGANDAKEELSYFVNFLKNPKEYLKKGVKAPKGLLLYGPPGTGKTLLAKAMAGESNVTFISAEGNQFLKKYMGEGSEKVHELFAKARKYAPSILFIDEIDAIAKNRNSEDGEKTGDVLTSFLTEMDGFNSKTDKPVFVLAATNYDIDQSSSRSIDPALLRRFDRKILVDLPNKDERISFINYKIAKNKIISLSEEQIDNIAIRSTGMSLSDLDNIFEFAIRNSIKNQINNVTDSVLEDAFESYNSGEEKKWDSNLLIRTARHEAGHALLCWLSGEKPSYLTIVARGDHGGYMQHGENENKGLYTKVELVNKVRTSLAGRAAEIVYYGERDGVSTGASGDLQHATNIVERMICTYGMDEDIGLGSININTVSNSTYYSVIKNKIDKILLDEFNETKSIIANNKVAIDKLVDALLEKSHIKGDEIDKILREAINNI